LESWGLKVLGFWGFAIRIESFGVLVVLGVLGFWGFGVLILGGGFA